jgi:hypothetical protein
VAHLPWVPDGDIVADLLADFPTRGGATSVWLIEDDRSNLDRVLVALAVNCQRFTNIDYILFDPHLLSQADVKSEKIIGETPDDMVNARWHLNLVQLSGHKLVSLTRRILEQSEAGGVLKKRLEDLALQALGSSRLNIGKINAKMKEELRKLQGAQRPL